MKEIKQKSKELIEKLGLEQEKTRWYPNFHWVGNRNWHFGRYFHQPEIVFLDRTNWWCRPITRRQFWDLIYDASEQGITIL